MSIGIGDTAPDFTLHGTGGRSYSLSEFSGCTVVLVFYPGDDTPVCTKQLCDYRDHIGVFGDLGVQVIGLNHHGESSHEAFAKKHHLPFPLLSDEGGKVCKQYGALNFLGMAKRALVLIGRDGRVKWRRTDFPLFHQNTDDVKNAIAELAL